LRHVLVGGADDDPLDAVLGGEPLRGGGDRIVGLELDHRPEHDAERLDRSLGDRELGEELGVHPGLGLVAGVALVAERADDAVGRAADVRRTLVAEEVEELLDESGHAREEQAVAAADRRARGEVRPEQLVRRVDEVDLHG
jgi:hypothetical protein